MRTPTNEVNGSVKTGGSRWDIKARRAIPFLLNMGFPWVWKRNDPWSCAAREALLTRWPEWLRPLVWLTSALVWPFVSLWQSIWAVRIVRHQGPSYLWLSCWKAALIRNVPPREFVLYRLWRDGVMEGEVQEDGIRECGWRFDLETSNLLSQITSPEAGALVRDKRAFHEWLATLSDPAVPAPPLLDALPDKGSVVTKPRLSLGGRGVLFWTQEGGMWRPFFGFGKSRLPPKTADAVLRVVAEEDLILQPEVLPDPNLRHPLVARILTMRTGAGPRVADRLNPKRPLRVGGAGSPLKARAMDACVQLPALHDRASHRGPLRLVDIATGKIRSEGPGARSLTETGIRMRVPIEGVQLPGWKGIVAALEAAHDALTGHAPILGWDVIWGADGPLVLEANIGISFAAWQFDRLEPLWFPDLRK